MADNYTVQDSHEASSLIAALQKLKCDSIHYIGQGVCPRCLSTAHDALAAALAVVRSEGRAAGLEELEATAGSLPRYEINDACDGQNSRGCLADIDYDDNGRFVRHDDLLAAIRALKEKP